MPFVDRHYQEWALVAKKIDRKYGTEWRVLSQRATREQKDYLALAYLTHVKEHSTVELASGIMMTQKYPLSESDVAELLHGVDVEGCVQREVLFRERPFHFSKDRAFWIATEKILRGTYNLGEYNPNDQVTSMLEEFLEGGIPTVHDFLHALNSSEPQSRKLEIVCRMM